MKKLLLVLTLLASGAVTGATDTDRFLAQRIAELFAEAKPIGQGLWVTDKAGCLYSITQSDQQLAVVQLKDQARKPVCRN